MRYLLGFLSCLVTIPACAGADELIGAWEGGDTAAVSIYGVLKISSTTVSWGGHHSSHPKCKARYVVVPEEMPISFKDQVGSVFSIDKDGRYIYQQRYTNSGELTETKEKRYFSTYLLKVDGGKCLNGLVHLRLTFPLENELRLLNMIEYGKGGQIQGQMHFHKIANKKAAH